jgi:hypothetical protein
MESRKCDRCDGEKVAIGSDRPFEWSGPGTYPGPCPKCKGTGIQPRELTDAELEAVAAGKGYAMAQAMIQNRPLLARQSWNHRQEAKARWLFTAAPAGTGECSGGTCRG